MELGDPVRRAQRRIWIIYPFEKRKEVFLLKKSWRNFSKRGLSLLVCLVMCLSMLPGVAYAEEEEKYCTICVKKTTQVYIPEQEATCTQEGVKAHYICTSCGNNLHRNGVVYVRKVDRTPALGHNMSHHDAQDATCVNAGNVEYWFCSRCNKNFADKAGTEEIPDIAISIAPNNHMGNEVRGYDEAGHWTKWDCCDAEVEDSRESHSFEGATCLTAGECYVCGVKGVDPAAHDFDASTDHLAVNNQHAKKCARCDAYDPATLEDHTVTNWFPDASSAGCTETVTQTGVCTVCSAELTRTIPAAGEHDWVRGEIASGATCIFAAKYNFKCSNCDATKQEYVGKELGHDFSLRKPASGNPEGYHVIECARCHNQTSGEREPHEWVYGEWTITSRTIYRTKTCALCGQEGKKETHILDTKKDPRVTPATCISPETTTFYYKITQETREITIETAPKNPDAHKFGDWEEAGTGHRHTCTLCGKEVSGPHNLGSWQVDLDSHKQYAECTDCKHIVWQNLDHRWNEGSVTQEPTCVEKGVKTYKCEYCDETYTEDIEATGEHIADAPIVTPATCEARGTKITSCKDCGTVLVTEVILPLGHEYTSAVTKPATCVELGVKTFTCQREGCSDAYTDKLPLVPHTLTVHAEKKPACTENGMKAHSTCSVCNGFFTGAGTSLKETTVEALTIPAIGHAYGAWTITAAPTMSAPGEARRICANDESHVETVELPQLPDPGTPDSVWTLDTERSAAPTCTESGENMYVSVYGEVRANVPALGHSFSDTWTYDGASHWHACARCGIAGGAAAHAYDGGVVTLAPTADTAGVRTYTCTACGRYYTEAIPATGTTGPVFPAPDPGTPGSGSGGTNNPPPTETIIDEDTPLADITFDDVMPTDPFYEAVQYVFNRKLMNGVSDTSFDPYGTLTRAMVVTILYRLEGEPAAEPSAFLDVAAGQWYTDAVGWGAANKVVKGYSEDRFGPMDPVTREQLAAILHRYAQYKGYEVTEITDLTAYADMASISEYALEAMAWAIALGAPEALSETALAPRDNATRAQVAVAFMNFCEKYIPLETEGEAA